MANDLIFLTIEEFLMEGIKQEVGRKIKVRMKLTLEGKYLHCGPGTGDASANITNIVVVLRVLC